MITTTLEAIWVGGAVAISTVAACRYTWLARQHHQHRTVVSEVVAIEFQAHHQKQLLTEAFLEARRVIREEHQQPEQTAYVLQGAPVDAVLVQPTPAEQVRYQPAPAGALPLSSQLPRLTARRLS